MLALACVAGVMGRAGADLHAKVGELLLERRGVAERALNLEPTLLQQDKQRADEIACATATQRCDGARRRGYLTASRSCPRLPLPDVSRVQGSK